MRFDEVGRSGVRFDIDLSKWDVAAHHLRLQSLAVSAPHGAEHDHRTRVRYPPITVAHERIVGTPWFETNAGVPLHLDGYQFRCPEGNAEAVAPDGDARKVGDVRVRGNSVVLVALVAFEGSEI